MLTTMPNAAAAEIGLRFGTRGAALSYACACASSAVAIGEAMRAIRGGWLDVAIGGGHEAMLTPGTMAGWHAMRAMAAPPADAPASACRPFAADRAGFALGEGAAALVIECREVNHELNCRAPCGLSKDIFTAAPVVTIAYMANLSSNSQDSWWHERPTKAAELDSSYQPPLALRPRGRSVWKEGALVVGVIFALALSLIHLVGQ